MLFSYEKCIRGLLLLHVQRYQDLFNILRSINDKKIYKTPLKLVSYKVIGSARYKISLQQPLL